MKPSIFDFINEISAQTKANLISWEKHSEMPYAYFFQYFKDNDLIQVVLDTYDAVFKDALAKCINFSVVNLNKNIVHHEVVRCKNSDGKFLEEYKKLNDLYSLCKQNFEARNQAMNQIGIPLNQISV